MSPWTNHHSFHKAQKLAFLKFEIEDQNPLLTSSVSSTQVRYLYKYLSGLNCKTVIVEPNYFDRDYLSEFSEFYSHSARGYSNLCQRFHFFSQDVSEPDLASALGEDDSAQRKLSDSYLGFTVVRPIPGAPIGRTVLTWFPDKESPAFPRIKAQREYKVHLSGLELTVHGLAWQQQDGAVGACATIALWSAIHSAAFDETHRIPTTAEITKLAHKTASQGARIFPTEGLTNGQLLEAIKELGLAPAIDWGDAPNEAFSPKKFSTICSTYLRSGFPIILGGRYEGSQVGHATCLTGFREPKARSANPKEIAFRGEPIEVVYIHDDNIGPNVRHSVNIETSGTVGSQFQFVTIKPEAPRDGTYGTPGIIDPTATAKKFLPERMRIAMPTEIRLSASVLFERTELITKYLCNIYNKALAKSEKEAPGVGFHFGNQYMKASDYVGGTLSNTLAKVPGSTLGATRLALLQQVAPMSLFLGVSRIWYGEEPLVDVLFDTSDSDSNFCAFAHVFYVSSTSGLVERRLA